MSFSLRFVDAALIVLGLYFIKRWITRPPAPLPPGPRAWPIIGNMLDMPASQEWLTFAEWGEKWGTQQSKVLTLIVLTNALCPFLSGDIVTVSILGKRIIILNSAQAAFDMLDKKSSIYSGRPELHMCELSGWNNLIIMMQPDQERFRNTRKHIHQAVGTSIAMKNFHAVEEEETRKFVKRTLSDPEGLFEHVRR